MGRGFDGDGVAGQGDDRVQIHLIGDAIAQGGDGLGGLFRLVGGDQSQMAFHDAHGPGSLHRAQHRNAGIMGDHLAQFLFVPRTADLVEDHPGDAQASVEIAIAQQKRGDAAGHARGIDHQHHRRIQPMGQTGGGIGALEVDSVEQALVALDQAEIGVQAGAVEQGADFLGRLGVEIQVAALPPAGGAQPQRVDIIGALLERLHPQSPCRQGGGQADAHRGLARRFMCRRDQQPGAGR